MKQRAALFHEEVSPKRLYTSVKEISDHHRIQVSQGFRDAAEYVCRTLNNNGIEAKVLSYPSNPDIWYLGSKMFLEWKPECAYLELEEPNLRLADYGEEPMSVVQRSYPCDFTDGAELVFLDKGCDPAAYEGMDFEGKVVFMHENFHDFEWLFGKGIKGFITDYIAANENRSRSDLYHSLTYTSFWWKHTPEEIHTCGFVLSPCEGDKLEALIKARHAEGKKCVVKGKVESTLKPGFMEVVEATLPGTEEGEVLLSAHLCHPKTSANDNASGCAANMEVLRVLKKLMDNGKLPRNRRTIKAIFMPEFAGTYAYLSDHTDYDKMIGALNLDMVGGKQTRAYGPITLTFLPKSMPSIVQPLTHMALELAGREAKNLLGDYVPVTNYITEPFTGGSDHLVYSHPDFAVPCCMLGQWPDLNYHTATDTLDVIDPEVLAFSTRVSCNFAYMLANLSEEDLPAILEYMHLEMTESFNKVSEAYREGKIAEEDLIDHLDFESGFYEGCAQDIARVLPGVSEEVIEDELEYITMYAAMQASYLKVMHGPCHDFGDARVFKKNWVGPLQSLDDNMSIVTDPETIALYNECRKVCGGLFRKLTDLTAIYVNGERTVGEMNHLISMEVCRKVETEVEACLKLYVSMGLMEQM